MSEHHATIVWKRTSADFKYENYNRAHEWRFDGGTIVPGTAAPAYRGEPDRVDPEEALVASLSACHMLTFLAIASRHKFTVDSYVDEAVGVMTKNEKGKLWISRVTLHPRIVFSGNQPTQEQLANMHHHAHEECFIANSVKTEVVVEAG